MEPIGIQNLVAKMEELAKPEKFGPLKTPTKFKENSQSATSNYKVDFGVKTRSGENPATAMQPQGWGDASQSPVTPLPNHSAICRPDIVFDVSETSGGGGVKAKRCFGKGDGQIKDLKNPFKQKYPIKKLD